MPGTMTSPTLFLPSYQLQTEAAAAASSVAAASTSAALAAAAATTSPVPPTTQFPSPSAAAATPAESPGEATVPEVVVVPLKLELGEGRAAVHRVAGAAALRALTESVEDVVVALVQWGRADIKKYKERLKQDRSSLAETDHQAADAQTWYADKIRELEAQIGTQRLVTEIAVQIIKNENEAKVKALSKEPPKEELRSVDLEGPLGQQRLPMELLSKMVEEQETPLEQLLEKLQSELDEKEKELAALRQCLEEEKEGAHTDRQAMAMTFVLKMDSRDEDLLRQAALAIDPERLAAVAQQLFREYQVRLLGVDTGLSFLMEAPTSHWSAVVGSQLEIRSALNKLLAAEVKEEAYWRGVTRCSHGEVEVVLGRPANVMLDPISETPQRVFTARLATERDKSGQPEITNLICCQHHGLLVAVDVTNKAVKTLDVDLPYTVVASRTFDEEPGHLASLPDGLVALTTESRLIYLLHVDREIEVHSRIETDRRYSGVAGVPDGGDSLVVSCVRFGEEPACVEVINREGEVLRTLVDQYTMPDLHLPFYLCPAPDGRSLLVSDCSTNCLYRLSLDSAEVLEELVHPDLRKPRQVCYDRAGNLYVASYGTHCALARSPAGCWRRLFSALQHGDRACNRPSGICVTNTGVVIVSWLRRLDCHNVACVVIGHRLDKAEEEGKEEDEGDEVGTGTEW